jgi:hypothetical protein
MLCVFHHFILVSLDLRLHLPLFNFQFRTCSCSSRSRLGCFSFGSTFFRLVLLAAIFPFSQTGFSSSCADPAHKFSIPPSISYSWSRSRFFSFPLVRAWSSVSYFPSRARLPPVWASAALVPSVAAFFSGQAMSRDGDLGPAASAPSFPLYPPSPGRDFLARLHFFFVHQSESGYLLLGLHFGAVAFNFGSVFSSASRDCFDFLQSEQHPMSLPSCFLAFRCFSMSVIFFDSRFGESYCRWKSFLFLNCRIKDSSFSSSCRTSMVIFQSRTQDVR